MPHEPKIRVHRLSLRPSTSGGMPDGLEPTVPGTIVATTGRRVWFARCPDMVAALSALCSGRPYRCAGGTLRAVDAGGMTELIFEFIGGSNRTGRLDRRTWDTAVAAMIDAVDRLLAAAGEQPLAAALSQFAGVP